MRINQRPTDSEQSISVWSSALFLLFVLLKMLFDDFDFRLTEYSTFYISRATLDGISVSQRVSFFYKLCGVCFLLLPILYFTTNRLLRRIPKAIPAFSYLSISGILLLVSDLLNYHSEGGIKVVAILLVATALIHAFAVFRHVSKAWGALILLSFIFTTNIVFLFNSSRIVVAQIDTIFLLTILFSLVGYYVLVSKFGFRSRSVFASLLALTLSPLLIFISVECHFLLRDSGIEFPYKWAFVALMLLLLGLSFVLRKRWNVNSDFLISRYYASAALLSFLILTIYHPIVGQSNDLFELANPANGQMRLFLFGEIPFVDFMTSHMFSEQFYGIVYHLFFGYDGSLDFLTYSFFNSVLFYLLAFCFLRKLFASWVPAIVLSLALPYFNLIFSTHLFYSVLALLACLRVSKSESIKNYLILVLVLVALIVWRLDTGVAALFGSAIFLPLLFIIDQKTPVWKTAGRAMGISVLIALLSVLIAVSVRSVEYISENFKTALHYVAGSQAHGYTTIANEFNHQFFIIHFLLPLLAIVAIFFGVKKLRFSESKNGYLALKSGVFFFLVFLANFPRGLVRHGFLEYSDDFYTSTFYLATGLFAISFIKNNRPVVRYVVFSIVSFSAVLGIKYFPLPNQSSPLESYLDEPTLMNFDSELNYSDGRVAGSQSFASENYEDLKTFMDTNMDENQTFLDFSNSPMLYYYCGREVPSYFAQSLQNSIDDLSQLNHLSRLDTSRIPVVVYSHMPPNWFDATDGVQNAMRYYLIAEYIYRYYRPSSVINGYSIWTLKKENPVNRVGYDDAIMTPYYDYGHAASVILKHFEHDPEAVQEISTVLVQSDIVSIDEKLLGLNSLWLSVRVTENSHDGHVQLALVENGRAVGAAKFFCKKGQQEYMIPLTNFLSWHELSPAQLKFDVSEGVNLESITFYKDLRIED